MTIAQATSALPTSIPTLRADLAAARAAHAVCIECNAPQRAAIYAARVKALTEILTA